MEIERRAQNFPRAQALVRLDRLRLTPSTHPELGELWAALPSLIRVELDSFVAEESGGYFEDVSAYFEDATNPEEPFCLSELRPGSPTRTALERALEQLDASWEMPAEEG